MTTGNEYELARQGAWHIAHLLELHARMSDRRVLDQAAACFRLDADDWNAIAGHLAVDDIGEARGVVERLDTASRDYIDELPKVERDALATVLGLEVL